MKIAPYLTHEHAQLSKAQVTFLDLLRAVAAQLVVIQHAYGLSRRTDIFSSSDLGHFAVTIFFILSGFLIGHTTVKRVRSGFSLIEFIVDRWARIYVCFVPALIFAAVCAYWTVDLATFPAERNTGPLHFIGNLLMLQDYPIFQVLRRIIGDSWLFVRPYALAEPFWTVSVEWWLYVSFGIAVYIVTACRTSFPIWLWMAFLISCGSTVYHAATGAGECLTLMWIFGALSSNFLNVPNWLRTKLNFSTRAVRVVGTLLFVLAMILLALRGTSRGLVFYDLQTALFLTMAMVGGLWVLSDKNVLPNEKLTRPIAGLAAISYPLYLIHNPVLGLFVIYFGPVSSMWEALTWVMFCNVVAALFWIAFDRHYRDIARQLKNFLITRYSSTRARIQ